MEYEDTWDALHEVNKKYCKNSGTILINITLSSENTLSFGIFEEPDDVENVFL